MTRLTPNKPLMRLTDAKERAEPLVIELHPLYLRIRTKGSREGFNLPYGAVLDLARKLAARKENR